MSDIRDHYAEALLQKQATAPRVTAADVDAATVHVDYVTHTSVSGQILRWCVITTPSGFAVTGDPSAAVNAENDNPELGKKLAYDNARNKMWMLMGFALKERQFQEKSNGS